MLKRENESLCTGIVLVEGLIGWCKRPGLSSDYKEGLHIPIWNEEKKKMITLRHWELLFNQIWMAKISSYSQTIGLSSLWDIEQKIINKDN